MALPPALQSKGRAVTLHTDMFIEGRAMALPPAIESEGNNCILPYKVMGEL